MHNTTEPGPAPGSDHADQADEARDEVLVEALASRLTYAEAGKKVQVTARTVSRRMEDPAFASRVASRKKELASEAIEQIRRVSQARVEGVLRSHQVLVELLSSDNPKIQLAAARQLHGMHAVVSSIEFEDRLLRLEDKHAAGSEVSDGGWSL